MLKFTCQPFCYGASQSAVFWCRRSGSKKKDLVCSVNNISEINYFFTFLPYDFSFSQKLWYNHVVCEYSLYESSYHSN